MVSVNRNIYRSPRMTNMKLFDSINWYQSDSGDPRPYTRRQQRPYYKEYRKGRRYDKNYWNQQKREVLEGLKEMNLSDWEENLEPRTGTFRDLQKLKRCKCYICHTRGHGFWNCPNKDRLKNITKGKQSVENPKMNFIVPKVSWLVIGTDEKTWNEIWYVTNDYPRHMTPNLGFFEKFKKDTAGTSSIGKDGLDVRGLGIITVDMNAHKFIIPGALYVLNIGINMLSLSQLEQQGFEVTIKDGK